MFGPQKLYRLGRGCQNPDTVKSGIHLGCRCASLENRERGGVSFQTLQLRIALHNMGCKNERYAVQIIEENSFLSIYGSDTYVLNYFYESITFLRTYNLEDFLF